MGKSQSRRALFAILSAFSAALGWKWLFSPGPPHHESATWTVIAALAALESVWVAVSLRSSMQKLGFLIFGAGIAAGAVKGVTNATAANMLFPVQGVLFASAAVWFALAAARDFNAR